jgi:small-conductance mechanosensitive channel
VGDRINLSKVGKLGVVGNGDPKIFFMQDSYTVKEIRLLSTIFLDSNGTLVQAPNSELNKMVGYVHFLVVKYGQAFFDSSFKIFDEVAR